MVEGERLKEGGMGEARWILSYKDLNPFKEFGFILKLVEGNCRLRQWRVTPSNIHLKKSFSVMWGMD